MLGCGPRVLKAAMVSTDKVIEVIGLLKSQLETTMFAAGIRDTNKLKKTDLLSI